MLINRHACCYKAAIAAIAVIAALVMVAKTAAVMIESTTRQSCAAENFFAP